MANLDLVITADTLTAHLAGALGRPVWLGLKHVPEWRWMVERLDSPWYPSMRLFRRASGKDRECLFRQIATAISKFIRSVEYDSAEMTRGVMGGGEHLKMAHPGFQGDGNGGCGGDDGRCVEMTRAGVLSRSVID